MEFVIDLTFFENLADLPPWLAIWELFINGGWIILVVVFIWAMWQFWMNYIRNKYESKIEYTLLAIDVPKENEQGPKAVEQIFSQIAGAGIYDRRSVL